jgi:bifunctional UDP-N-acetylglucosamine pyrophosphorylase / glucosamine-1-phosphate N-acetyltransferase
MKMTTIILAAGKGTRMRSEIPKVLHKIANKSLLEHVYDLGCQLDNNQMVVVYGHGGETVKQALWHFNAEWVEQKQQLGTGHAVQQAVSYIGDGDTVLILYGDVPLLKLATIKTLLANVSDSTMGLLTVNLQNPAGYGRIIRNTRGQVVRIVEEKDATPDEKQVTEGNTGILALKGDKLKQWLSRLGNSNAQGEYYLTDVIAMAVNDGVEVIASQADNEAEVLGVNNRVQLAYLERIYQQQQAERLMEQGVTLADPARFDMRGTLAHLGQDIEIDVNVVLEGTNSIGSRVSIAANNVIRNCLIEDEVEILPNCVIENTTIGKGSRIGPFARIRPDTILGTNVHIGNFVEVKKSTVADSSKINHLSYIGDTLIGSRVNVGAGTITCNYDGANKYQTIIEDGAFIGSDTQLVAPVRVGKNATIGAGSTITKDSPDNQLTLTRVKQITVEGWQRPVKKEK